MDPVGEKIVRGGVTLPGDSEPVTDADEEVRMLHPSRSRHSSNLMLTLTGLRALLQPTDKRRVEPHVVPWPRLRRLQERHAHSDL